MSDHSPGRIGPTLRWWQAGLLGIPALIVVAAFLWHEARGFASRTAPVPVRATSSADRWGSYDKLFAADSPWNSRPVEPVFGTYTIPKSDYFPSVAEGAWSTGVFLAKADDPAVVVKGLPGTAGVWDPDVEQARDVAIPRWPAEVTGATGTDGHAEIVDPILGVVHSFWQLKKVRGEWTAAVYAWSRIDGRGWGDPAHYYQGARAAAVPSSGGLIRTREVDDGDTLYRHALAISLTFNALSADPTYIYPATSADTDAAKTNSGAIPEGALLMLPPSFDVAKLGTPALRKIAETLKTYGGYVVDRNEGTPYSIYVEVGSGYNLHRRGWSNPAGEDLEAIRLGLRQVVSAKGWVDGDGKPFVPDRNLNRLSMRGPWRATSGPETARFDSWKQAVVFDNASTERTVLVNDSGRSMQPVRWAIPSPGTSYTLSAIATGGAKLRLALRSKNGNRALYDSGELADGEAATFEWPADCLVAVHAISGSGRPSSVRGELVATRR